MKKRELKFMLVALPIWIFGYRSAIALSLTTDVTPANIADQPLTIRIESNSAYDHSVGFTIFVSSKEHDISPHREGRFEIAGEELMLRDDMFGPMPRPVIWCSIQEHDEDGVLVYRVGVEKSMLARASFTFRNFEPRGMPAFDGYRLLLKEFAVSE